jgi:hypothetical protein
MSKYYDQYVSKFVVVIVLILIQACSSQSEYKTQLYNEEQKITGYYIFGHEVNTFQPCHQKNIYWVLGSNKTLEVLNQEYSKYTSEPYEEVYLELEGDYRGKATDGFAMDYEGQINIRKIIAVKKKSQNNCK